jgi:hypothetical protein
MSAHSISISHTFCLSFFSPFNIVLSVFGVSKLGVHIGVHRSENSVHIGV